MNLFSTCLCLYIEIECTHNTVKLCHNNFDVFDLDRLNVESTISVLESVCQFLCSIRTLKSKKFTSTFLSRKPIENK